MVKYLVGLLLAVVVLAVNVGQAEACRRKCGRSHCQPTCHSESAPAPAPKEQIKSTPKKLIEPKEVRSEPAPAVVAESIHVHASSDCGSGCGHGGGRGGKLLGFLKLKGRH